MEHIFHRLRDKRLSLGLSQADVAGMANVTQAKISLWESLRQQSILAQELYWWGLAVDEDVRLHIPSPDTSSD